MTDQMFYKLWMDALSQPDEDMYIAEYGYPDYFDEIGKDYDEVVSVLRSIHKIAHISFKEILKESGLTQRGCSIKFCIPLRTIENWCLNTENARKCPDWIRLMFCRQLGLLKIEESKNEEN